MNLPSVPMLLKRAKALAVFEIILSPDWERRTYSFDANWAPDQVMASMRNGSGDEWWMVFHKSGCAALKGFGHESVAWSKGKAKLADSLKAVFPPELNEFTQEPAFQWDATTFAYFCISPPSGWIRANDLTLFADISDTGEETLLRHLIGTPKEYASFASAYHETPVSIEIVSAVFGQEPLTKAMVQELNSEISLEDIASDLSW